MTRARSAGAGELIRTGPKGQAGEDAEGFARDALSGLGAVLIVGSGLYALHRETVRRRQAAANPDDPHRRG